MTTQIQNQADDMSALTARTERLVGAITNAILATAETAAERIELAAKVAQVNQRMAAFSSVLEVVGVQKDALQARMLTATGATRRLLERQVEMLTVQEISILEGAGIPQESAQQAVKTVDELEPVKPMNRIQTNGVPRRVRAGSICE